MGNTSQDFCIMVGVWYINKINYAFAFIFPQCICMHSFTCMHVKAWWAMWQSRNIAVIDPMRVCVCVWQVRTGWCRPVCMMFRWPCRRRPDCCWSRTPRTSTISAVRRESHQPRSPVRVIHSHLNQWTGELWTLIHIIDKSLDVYMTLAVYHDNQNCTYLRYRLYKL